MENIPAGQGGVTVSGATFGAVIPFLIGPEAEMRAVVLSQAENRTLRSIIGDLYRVGTSVRDGSTTAAIRQEFQMGLPVRGEFHFMKGVGYRNGLQNLPRNPSLNSSDRAIIKRLLLVLQNALSGR
jgi:hypothetical protein